ncbi:inositol monophosphatase [Marinomonas sp. THO17]|uniref:inositol monophosphatase family protein n=1 Tax=Marinomonas sp. THO17 TaxID=3149048 RepID=UPI00336BFE10
MNLDQTTQDTLINILRRTGQEVVMPYFRQLDSNHVQQKTSRSDLVTIADQASEDFISKEIRRCFPNWAIVGEEAVAADPSVTDHIARADVCVIIDPIDGTWNFAHGLSDFGIILAVVVKGVTRFGILYDPVNDDWVYANLGEGAYYQATDLKERGTYFAPEKPPIKLEISQDMPLEQQAGIMSIHSYQGARKQEYAIKATRFARINNLPSCPAYRQLALGHFQFTLTYKMMPWDHAAGVLIFTEAGGVCRLFSGEEYHPSMLDGEMLAAQSEADWQALAAHFRQ